MHFLEVIMASGIARGRVRTTMMTELCKMLAIVQFIASFFDTGHQCYGQLTPVKTYFLLMSIT